MRVLWFRFLRGALAAALPLLTACDGSSVSADGGGLGGLGGTLDPEVLVRCQTASTLSFGRCVDGDGVPCTGGEATTAAFFEALPPDGALIPVIGPQGSAMFALAVRAPGIQPGDAESVFSSDNPILEVDLLDEAGSEVVAAYRGRSGFRTVATAPDTFENAQVFVIVDHSTSSFRGQRLRVDALVTDSAGEHRCGSLIFRAGSE